MRAFLWFFGLILLGLAAIAVLAWPAYDLLTPQFDVKFHRVSSRIGMLALGYRHQKRENHEFTQSTPIPGRGWNTSQLSPHLLESWLHAPEEIYSQPRDYAQRLQGVHQKHDPCLGCTSIPPRRFFRPFFRPFFSFLGPFWPKK